MKRIIAISICAILIIWGAWRWIVKGQAAVLANLWQQTVISRGDLIIGVPSTGNVQPQNRVAIKAPVPGRIEEILVREGDWVKRGQILAWMSSGDRASLLDAARAKGPEELKRWEDLYKATPLISPITGTIIARNVEPGQSVTTGDSPLVVSDRLIIKAQVDETDIAKVKLGQRASVSLDAYPDQPTDATVDHIAYEARTVSNVTIYDVDVLPNKVPSFMRSGMTANVNFQIEAHRNVLILPSEALQNDGQGGSYVFVPAPSTITAQAAPGAKDKKHQSKEAKQDAWKPKNPNSVTQNSVFEAWIQDPGAPKPVTLAVQTGLSDDAHMEIVSGLNEGDIVLIKSVTLPEASSAKNPLSMNITRPKTKTAKK